jgi:UDP-GlcNAc:undecaprenyl-phosphate GlcNAc-1-phosphate transferase
VVILWGWSALLSGFVLWPTYSGNGDAIVPMGIGAIGLLLFTVLHPRFRSSTEPFSEEPVSGEPVPEEQV